MDFRAAKVTILDSSRSYDMFILRTNKNSCPEVFCKKRVLNISQKSNLTSLLKIQLWVLRKIYFVQRYVHFKTKSRLTDFDVDLEGKILFLQAFFQNNNTEMSPFQMVNKIDKWGLSVRYFTVNQWINQIINLYRNVKYSTRCFCNNKQYRLWTWL